jgi:hypothetical protein
MRVYSCHATANTVMTWRVRCPTLIRCRNPRDILSGGGLASNDSELIPGNHDSPSQVDQPTSVGGHRSGGSKEPLECISARFS